MCVCFVITIILNILLEKYTQFVNLLVNCLIYGKIENLIFVAKLNFQKIMSCVWLSASNMFNIVLAFGKNWVSLVLCPVSRDWFYLLTMDLQSALLLVKAFFREKLSKTRIDVTGFSCIMYHGSDFKVISAFCCLIAAILIWIIYGKCNFHCCH